MEKSWMLISLVALFLSSCNVKTPGDGKIVVDMAQKGANVSPSMYGIFFEEINHAGEGGLYAELVQNRGFEEKEYPEGYNAKGNKLYPPALKNHLSGTLSNSSYRWRKSAQAGRSKPWEKLRLICSLRRKIRCMRPLQTLCRSAFLKTRER
jgi:alpha-N-arabinofuranosidase